MGRSSIVYFTPGPVQMSAEICAIGGRQVPYFRNDAFSEVVLDCERMLLQLAKAPEGSRVVLLTCSGTGGLEAALANFADAHRPTLVINSRGFGQRLVDICAALGRPVREYALPLGVAFKAEHAASLDLDGCGAVACDAHDTITGVRNDIGALSRRGREIFLIVDAISSFLCDPIDMQALGIDVLVTGSQKALALPPGLAVLVLSPKAVAAVQRPEHRPGSYYFDLAPYLRDGARGQTPFTPAVGIIYQLQERLKELARIGVDEQVRRTGELARHFRERLAALDLPFRIYPDVASNAVTVLEVTREGWSADSLVRTFASEFGILLTPNGGDLKHRVFRVSHMGVQTKEALDHVIELLATYAKREGR